MPGDKQWITVAEAARQSGIGVRTIQLWLKQGKIEGWKPGHDWLTTVDIKPLHHPEYLCTSL